MVLRQTCVAGLRAHVYCVVGLCLMPRLPIAVASPVVVEVHVLVDVLHAVAGHLKHGDEEGLVVGRADPVSLPVSEIFHPDLPEKRDQEGSHVSELLPDEAKQPVLGFSEGVGPRVAELEVVLVELAEEVIGVGHSGLFGLVDCIDNLKHLLAKELIVPTHNHSDILRAAVVENRIIDVGDCASALLVADESETSRRELIPRDEELDQVGSAVLRGVIDEDSAVVAVVLVDDRLYVVLVTIVLGIVSRGDYHAEGQLLAEGAETVFLLQSIHLFFDLLLHVALL